MAQQAKRDRAKILALAVIGVVFLVVDVFLLTLVVAPSAASTRAVPTLKPPQAQKAELALILPTRDPAARRPTRTPVPAATSWPTSTSTDPALVATEALPESTGLPETTAEEPPETATPPSTPVPESTRPAPTATPATGAHSALVTTPTPTLQTVASQEFVPQTNPGLPTETPQPDQSTGPSETPVEVSTDAAPSDATETPAASPSVTPIPPADPATLDDLPDFETFIRLYRNAIAGQSFEVVSLGVDRTNPVVPLFVLQVAGSDTNNVFAAQSRADALAYGGQFLDDSQSYLGNPNCAVAIESTYKTSNKDACSNTPAWCRVGDYDQAANSWTVTWAYVRGTFTGGSDTVEAWKPE